MAINQSDIDAAKRRRLSGVARVREGDTWVEYAPGADQADAIADAEAEVQGRAAPQGTKFVSIKSGYKDGY